MNARIAFALLAGLAASGCTTMVEAERPPIGVQLYTVREDMARDPIATLQRIAAMGFDEVEFARTFGDRSAEMCRETTRLGLDVAAVHVGWELLRDDPARALAEAKAMCTDTLILAYLPVEERTTLEQWRGWIARLNAIAPLAEAEGIQLAYHAHDFEFATIDGVRPIDLMLRDFDPRIGFELDTYWVQLGGEDPLEFFRRHRDRITHFHMKDMGQGGAMADVGAGSIDFAALVEEFGEDRAYWLIERDDAPDPWASLAASLAAMRALTAATD
ncbi:MAG: sugar phosphate isomerase/epimerase [Erythrobacter sp.]|nr:MAG: sugar phosphate isomerase/epimerase [Erythrobacter sp.]